jgi:hypothetical protein
VAFVAAPGANVIAGNAFCGQPNGGIVLCTSARLVPRAPYTEARVAAAYLVTDFQALASTTISPREPDTRLAAVTRSVACGPQGSFAFDAVPDGRYFVVAADETKNVLISP